MKSGAANVKDRRERPCDGNEILKFATLGTDSKGLAHAMPQVNIANLGQVMLCRGSDGFKCEKSQADSREPEYAQLCDSVEDLETTRSGTIVNGTN